MQIINDNDRRFRIKNKINTNSQLKEQKGYKNLKAFVLTHLDLGDNITASPAVRYIATLFDEVIVVCKKKNSKNVKMFYADDPTIKFYEVFVDKEISPVFGFPIEQFNQLTKGYAVIACGMHCGKNIQQIPWDFYDHMSVPRNVFWDWFHVPSQIEGQQLYEKTPLDFVFIHNSCSKGVVFPIEYAERYLSISRNDYLFINPNHNCYEPGHRYYDLAQVFIDHPILYYKQIIENASYNIVSQSSFFCLAIQLDIKSDNNYYYSAFDPTYDYIWDVNLHPNNKKRFKQIPKI
jgi:hypothetical protein